MDTVLCASCDSCVKCKANSVLLEKRLAALEFKVNALQLYFECDQDMLEQAMQADPPLDTLLKQMNRGEKWAGINFEKDNV